MTSLVSTLQSATGEVVRWRGGVREVARLVRRGSPSLPGEVELEVLATGLNFRDVMSALGVYPGEAGALGYECVGRVVRAGDGADVAVGDRVMMQGEAGFARFVTVDARLVAPVPAGGPTAWPPGVPWRS
jgi:NADPH:quinone reductase-like Zn-dependent oxidoreductase